MHNEPLLDDPLSVYRSPHCAFLLTSECCRVGQLWLRVPGCVELSRSGCQGALAMLCDSALATAEGRRWAVYSRCGAFMISTPGQCGLARPAVQPGTCSPTAVPPTHASIRTAPLLPSPARCCCPWTPPSSRSCRMAVTLHTQTQPPLRQPSRCRAQCWPTSRERQP